MLRPASPHPCPTAQQPRPKMRKRLKGIYFNIPGFRKNDVSQKRVTGEHRDRPVFCGTRAKQGPVSLVRRRADIAFMSSDLNERCAIDFF